MDDMYSLGLALLVIFIIIMLWKKYHKSGFSSKLDDNNSSKSAAEKESENDPSMFFSDYGTGVINRQLASQYKNLQNMTDYEDYNEVTQYTSLEPEVFESQEEYSKDINRSTSGASAMTVRSDDSYPVTFWGLRRPDTHSTYSQPDARVVSTEMPDQLPAQTRYLI